MPFSGAKLRQLRERAGLERERLAEMAGTTKQYISHLENGVRKNPTYDLVEQLAVALGVDCRAFQEDVADDEPASAPPAPGPGRRATGKKG
jgi:transcriptional regulator with XRE-family HTH domain